MVALRVFLARFREVFRRSQLEQELSEEIKFHLEMETEHNLQNGMSEAQARRQARLSLGNPEIVKENCRDSYGFLWLDRLLQDLRYGLGQLGRNPGFTVVVVLSLGLVIGANTTIFSVINAILVQSIPYRNPDRLVVLSESRKNQPDQRRNPSLVTSSKCRTEVKSLEEIAVVIPPQPGTISARGQAESGWFVRVSPSFFAVLAIEPQLGRLFTDQEPSYEAGEPILLSDRYWRDHLGSDPGVLGDQLMVAGQTNTIVGVLPPGLRPPNLPESAPIDVWRSVNPSRLKLDDTQRPCTIGRLRQGFTVEQARLELEPIAKHLAGPASDTEEWRPNVEPLRDFLFTHWRERFYLLVAIALLSLLIGCINVSNLVLARSGRREKEISVRVSLGAGRGRLIRQLLTENILLASLGGVLGVLFTFWGIGLFVALAPDWWALPRAGIHIDATVLVFAAAVSMLTGVLFGLAPALRTSRPNLYEALKEGGRSTAIANRPLLRNSLVISEVSLTLFLLIGAGLVLHSFMKLKRVDPGYDPTNLLTVGVFLQGPEYWKGQGEKARKISPQTDRFWDDLLERTGALPGVRSAALNGWSWAGSWLHIVGESPVPLHQRPRVQFMPVSAGYFRTLEVPLLEGRGLADQDLEGAPWVAVINQAMARRFFADGDPVGRQIQLGFADGGTSETNAVNEPHVRTVVGVVGDIRTGLAREDVPTVYVPYRQHLWEFPMQGSAFSVSAKELILRTTSNPLALKGSVRKVITDIDEDEAPWYIRTKEQELALSLGPQRFWLKLFTFFASVALALVLVGVFGVVANLVSERTHEMGLRMALGAQRRDIFNHVIRQGLKLTLAGLGVGLALSLALSRFLVSLRLPLYEVEPSDPLTYMLAGMLLILVALAACYIPARRATRVDPLVALKYE